MALQSLTPPQDITWKRLAYSRDMIYNKGALRGGIPPKWRSSMAVYYFVVPEEETADAYPDSRILYLKITCSLTGWNPLQGLRDERKTQESFGYKDDLQRSAWEAVTSGGWASKYWPCLGAIMQVAIFPTEPTAIDDFPYIMDFEPKKRELYEAVSEGAEVLSGSSEKYSTTKSNTHSLGVEIKPEFTIGPVGFGGSGVEYGYKYEKVETSDRLQEDRATKSYSTSFSQMYQLFNGYHLGTNRSLFVVAPRPHTVSNSAQTEFNLIDGERKLEGVQDIFLVVHLPRTLTKFGIEASLDTGHNLTDIGKLLVTRRVIESRSEFDENGNLKILSTPDNDGLPSPEDVIVGEVTTRGRAIRNYATRIINPFGANTNQRTSKDDRLELVEQLNRQQREIVKGMLDEVSAGIYEPKKFSKTNAFQEMVNEFTVNQIQLPLTKLVDLGYLSRTEAQQLGRQNIRNVGDFFKEDASKLQGVDANTLKANIVKKIFQ